MWIIEARKAVGPLSIDDNIQELAQKLKVTYSKFKRLQEGEDIIFAFNSIDVHLTCNHSNRVKVISVFQPNKVTYCGIQLLGRKIERVTEQLRKQDIVTKEEDAGVWVEEAGVLLVEVDGIIDGIELYSE